VFMQYLDATDDFPFLAGRKAKIQFIELHANADRSSILPMQRPRPRLGPAAAASLNKYTPGLVSPPPPHRGGSGGGGCSGGGRGARAAGGRGEPPRTAARHPAIGAGGLTAARRVRMMKLSTPPASPPRTAAQHPAIGAGGQTAARRVRMMKLSKPASPPAHRRPTPGDRCRRPDGGPQSADDEVVEAASEPPAPHRRGWCRHLRASGGGGEGWGGRGPTSGSCYVRRAFFAAS